MEHQRETDSDDDQLSAGREFDRIPERRRGPKSAAFASSPAAAFVTLAGASIIVAVALWAGSDGPPTTGPSTYRDPALELLESVPTVPEVCEWPSPPYSVSRPWLENESGVRFWIDFDGAHFVVDTEDIDQAAPVVLATITADAKLSPTGDTAGWSRSGNVETRLAGSDALVTFAGDGEVTVPLRKAINRLEITVTDSAGEPLRPALRVGEYQEAESGMLSTQRCAR